MKETSCEDRRRVASEPFLCEGFGFVPVVLQTAQCRGDPILFPASEDRGEISLMNQKAGEVIALAHGSLVASLRWLVEAVKSE